MDHHIIFSVYVIWALNRNRMSSWRSNSTVFIGTLRMITIGVLFRIKFSLELIVAIVNWVRQLVIMQLSCCCCRLPDSANVHSMNFIVNKVNASWSWLKARIRLTHHKLFHWYLSIRMLTQIVTCIAEISFCILIE